MKGEFGHDKEKGEAVENEVRAYLERKGYAVTKTDDAEATFDLIAERNGKRRTYEIKFDESSLTTGNVAIELNKYVGGKYQPSGLSITKATFYIYKLAYNDRFYIVTPRSLRVFLEMSGKKFPIIKGGNNESCFIQLVPVEKFIEFATEIDVNGKNLGGDSGGAA